MGRNTAALGAERLNLEDELAALKTGARIRAISDFDPMDESSFYAEDGVREFTVVVVEDVTWGSDLSHYVEPSDEFRRLYRMTIEVPNGLEGHVAAIQHLFLEWFATTE